MGYCGICGPSCLIFSSNTYYLIPITITMNHLMQAPVTLKYPILNTKYSLLTLLHPLKSINQMLNIFLQKSLYRSNGIGIGRGIKIQGAPEEMVRCIT